MNVLEENNISTNCNVFFDSNESTYFSNKKVLSKRKLFSLPLNIKTKYSTSTINFIRKTTGKLMKYIRDCLEHNRKIKDHWSIIIKAHKNVKK